MRFLMCLPPLAVLPLVAAPVPKVSPDFTHTCTAEALAKLPFVDADPKSKDRESSETLAAKSVSVAVHLPRATFEEGDPIPALFAVKNRAGKPHGLWMEFDFDRRHSAGAGGVEVRNTKTDAVSSPFLARSTMCGGARWAIPANGYWTTRGDISVTGSGESLPVGDYELTWEYAGTRSKPVPFAVVARRLGRPAPEPRRALHLLRVQPGQKDGRLVWKRAEVTATPTAELAHALGTGALGAYHPSVRELPAVAGGLRAVAAWAGDAVQVTLDSPTREFDSLERRQPTVFLLVERATSFTEGAVDRVAEKAASRKDAAEDRLKLPATLEIRLPKGWRDTAGASGECRVSVLVASREPPVEYAPDGMRERIRELKSVRAVEAKGLPSKTKTGDWVLKTEWLAIKGPAVRE